MSSNNLFIWDHTKHILRIDVTPTPGIGLLYHLIFAYVSYFVDTHFISLLITCTRAEKDWKGANHFREYIMSTGVMR